MARDEDTKPERGVKQAMRQVEPAVRGLVSACYLTKTEIRKARFDARRERASSRDRIAAAVVKTKALVAEDSWGDDSSD